jgi:aryl-alcohol dehydrogenase-like predicted oxidoreductase
LEYRELGRSGIKISAIGLGTWQWGSREWGWNRLYTQQDVHAAFHRGLSLGINFVDTAEIYGHGKSEEILGKAIHQCREEVIIATKVWPWNLSYSKVLRAADGSLRRLNVDVIDLLQIHWPNRLVPIARTMRAMKKLVEKGKVRCIGVSNFNTSQMKAAQEALAPLDLVSNQVKYNLIDREIEKDLLPAAVRGKISIIAYSPLAKGLLTGKYTANSTPTSFVQRASSRFSHKNLNKLADLQETIKRIGDAHQRTCSQVALNWLIRRENVIAIPGAKRPSDVTDNAGAADWRLSESEIDTLERSAKIDFDKLSGLPNLIRALIPF